MLKFALPAVVFAVIPTVYTYVLTSRGPARKFHPAMYLLIFVVLLFLVLKFFWGRGVVEGGCAGKVNDTRLIRPRR